MCVEAPAPPLGSAEGSALVWACEAPGGCPGAEAPWWPSWRCCCEVCGWLEGGAQAARPAAPLNCMSTSDGVREDWMLRMPWRLRSCRRAGGALRAVRWPRRGPGGTGEAPTNCGLRNAPVSKGPRRVRARGGVCPGRSGSLRRRVRVPHRPRLRNARRAGAAAAITLYTRGESSPSTRALPSQKMCVCIDTLSVLALGPAAKAKASGREPSRQNAAAAAVTPQRGGITVCASAGGEGSPNSRQRVCGNSPFPVRPRPPAASLRCAARADGHTGCTDTSRRRSSPAEPE